MLHAIIMAGGAGTRFWPESRADTPKQLLQLAGERTMIQLTVDRLGDLTPSQRILVVTNQRLVDPIAEQLPHLPREAILGEPCKRDTAPCIGLAALVVSREDDDATMAVMPADHVIRPEAKFQAAIRAAAELVDREPERLVTFGVAPTYPAESFGYIERGEPLAGQSGVYAVRRFREKPDAKTATEYLAAGGFYWNAGIFVWKARTILTALEKHEPAMYAHLEAIAASFGTQEFNDVFRRQFSEIGGISIDYAVLENAEKIAVFEAPFEWDDVGSWQALARLRGIDESGNTIAAKHLGYHTTGTIVRGPADHLIVTLGISNCIVVHTPTATLVASKEKEEEIRQVVKELQERGWEEHL